MACGSGQGEGVKGITLKEATGYGFQATGKHLMPLLTSDSLSPQEPLYIDWVVLRTYALPRLESE
jgi:hypothetical protein